MHICSDLTPAPGNNSHYCDAHSGLLRPVLTVHLRAERPRPHAAPMSSYDRPPPKSPRPPLNATIEVGQLAR